MRGIWRGILGISDGSAVGKHFGCNIRKKCTMDGDGEDIRGSGSASRDEQWDIISRSDKTKRLCESG
jgi:hypothetical protein